MVLIRLTSFGNGDDNQSFMAVALLRTQGLKVYGVAMPTRKLD